MNQDRFTTEVSGKWVLTGEHSVLRGGTAVAIPHPELGLSLNFVPGGRFEVEPSGAASVIAELLDAVQTDCEANGKVFQYPQGRLTIRSSIPIGAGMGSSAALCVAMTRWLAEQLGLSEEQQLEFATRLEHRFHGRSSGMDIAVIATQSPISFVMGRGPHRLEITHLPTFTFHDTGLRCRTNEAVSQVQRFHEEFPMVAMQTDEAMAAASRKSIEGLIVYDQGDHVNALKLLAGAMKQAQECFYSWRLVPADAKRLEEELYQKGALAVKLTGAGGGGMLVALWD